MTGQQQSFPPATLETIERAINSEMARKSIPGLSVAVVFNHQLVWSNGYGVSDIENFVPAKASTNYRLGSISKPITAVAVLQLVEQGKIDLDAPIQKYCPSFPTKRWPLTTRHLLSHIGGIRHYRGDEINITKHYAKLVEGLEIFKDDSLLFEPGTAYAYTTYGYNLLGCIIEGASGMTYVEYVQKHIAQKAGMDRLQPDDVNAIIPNRAQGYQKLPNGELRNSNLANTSYKIPGGGWCSTVEDLARFAIAVQTNALLSPQTTAQMFTPQKLKNGKVIQANPANPGVSYGFGWFLDTRNGQHEVYHTGGQQRVNTLLYMLPARKCAVALMCNLEGAGLMNLAREIAEAVAKQHENWR
jgi:CubicO group peptidase (beta-lactamase class C family)